MKRMAASELVKGAGDPGLFGPGSVTWRIHAHPTMLIGGLRSLIVQALNPLSMAGVAQHSNYKDDSWGRLMRTTDYVMTTTYGDTAAAERQVKIVKTIHERVKGVDDFTGLPYSANDPELLLWVHCAQVDAFVSAYRAYGPGLSDEEEDGYVREMALLGEMFGISAKSLPRTMNEMRDYMDSQQLVCTPPAKDAMKFILFPPVPWPGGKLPEIPARKLLLIPGRAGYSLYSLATIAILPTEVRRAYRLPWVPLTPMLKASVFALTRTMRRVFPPPPTIRNAMERQRELEADNVA